MPANSAEEGAYIRNEARTLFRKNRDVSEPSDCHIRIYIILCLFLDTGANDSLVSCMCVYTIGVWVRTSVVIPLHVISYSHTGRDAGVVWLNSAQLRSCIYTLCSPMNDLNSLIF